MSKDQDVRAFDNIFANELALTGGLSRKAMKVLYDAAATGNLDIIKKLLTKYTPSLRGAIFDRRYVQADELEYLWKDILALGQNDGKLEKASDEERLAIYKKAKEQIDAYPARYPGNVHAELKAAEAYVDFAQKIYESDLGEGIEHIALARKALSDAVAIYEKHPEYVTQIPDANTLPVPDVVEENCTDAGKRYFQNKAMAEELIKLSKLAISNLDLIDKANNASRLHFAKAVLRQPAEALVVEDSIKRVHAANEDIECKNPLIDIVTEAWEHHVSDHQYADDDKHKAYFEAMMAQKNILDYLRDIAKDDAHAQMAVAVAVAIFAGTLVKKDDCSERKYFDAAVKWLRESIDLYKNQPEDVKKSAAGIEALYAISGVVAHMYATRHRDYVTNEELLQLFAEGRAMFPVDPLDATVVLGRHNGPTRLLQNTARILVKEKKYAEAIKFLEKSIRDNANTPDEGGDDLDQTQGEYSPYELLAYAYRQTGQAEKAISVLLKIRDYWVREKIANEQYLNQQLDVATLLQTYGYKITLPPQHYNSQEAQHEVAEALKEVQKANNVVRNLILGKYVGDFVSLSRKIIKAYLSAGQVEKAREEYNKVKALVDGLDKQAQGAGIDANPQMFTALQYEVLRSSFDFADMGMKIGLIPINANEKEEGKFAKKVVDDLEDVPAKLASATYIEERYASPRLKYVIRDMFRQLWSVPELKPILKAAALGVDKKLNGEGQLRFIFSREGIPGAHGFFAMRNLVQVAMIPADARKGLLDKDNIARIRDTLIHEMTHYVTHKLYNNDARPYAVGDDEARKAYRDNLRPDIQNSRDYLRAHIKDIDIVPTALHTGEIGTAQASVLRTFAGGYEVYGKEQRDGEYIVRIPQGLAKLSGLVGANHAGKLFEKALPNAYRHFKEVFTPDLEKMIAELEKKHGKESAAELLEEKQHGRTL